MKFLGGRNRRFAAILVAIAIGTATGIFIMRNRAFEARDGTAVNAIEGTTQAAAVRRTDSGRSADRAGARSPWLTEPPAVTVYSSGSDVFRQSGSRRTALKSPCESLHGAWHLADGSALTLGPNGRAELHALNGGVTPIYWNCHKAGTLDVMMPGRMLSLAPSEDGRLVGRGPTTTDSLTRSPSP